MTEISKNSLQKQSWYAIILKHTSMKGNFMKEKLPPPPVFNTPEEEDEFWQTHSPLDFEHEYLGIPAHRKFARPEVRLILRLSLQERELLNRIAEKIGEQPTELARCYIKSCLRADLERLNTSRS